MPEPQRFEHPVYCSQIPVDTGTEVGYNIIVNYRHGTGGTTVKRIEERAAAKINLTLDILGKRSDGYHSLRSVMQTVSLYDDIMIEADDSLCGACWNLPESKPNVPPEPQISLEIIDAPDLKPDSTNLAIKAALRFHKACPLPFPIRIVLRKRIPMAAGLAGGSADAAAVLRGLNVLCGEPFSIRTLCTIASDLGADVPFCVLRGASLCEGIGERLTPCTGLPAGIPIVLAKPAFGCRTPDIFRAYDANPDNLSGTDAMLKALSERDTAGVYASMGNALEGAACSLYPEIVELRARFMELGADAAQMSGSGPTVFGFFSTAAKAEYAAKQLLDCAATYVVYAAN